MEHPCQKVVRTRDCEAGDKESAFAEVRMGQPRPFETHHQHAQQEVIIGACTGDGMHCCLHTMV